MKFSLRKFAFVLCISFISLTHGAIIKPATKSSSSAATGKKCDIKPLCCIKGGRALGPITPDRVTKLNMYGSIVYGAQYLFTSDQLAKRLFTSAPGPVGKTLGKLVGAVLMSHAAVIYQIKNILKASDTEIARLNIFLSTAYLLTALWAHAKGYLKAYDSTIASVLCFVLNAFVGYA